jgi:hypothetical protein
LCLFGSETIEELIIKLGQKLYKSTEVMQ